MDTNNVINALDTIIIIPHAANVNFSPLWAVVKNPIKSDDVQKNVVFPAGGGEFSIPIRRVFIMLRLLYIIMCSCVVRRMYNIRIDKCVSRIKRACASPRRGGVPLLNTATLFKRVWSLGDVSIVKSACMSNSSRSSGGH